MTFEERLDSFASLEIGWDGYSGEPISVGVIKKSKDIARNLPGYDWQAIPLSCDGIQIEHHCDLWDIEIMLFKSGDE